MPAMKPRTPGTLGALVCQERYRRNLTLQELAAELGVRWQTVQLWETNKRLPSLRARKRLADVLAIPAAAYEEA